METVLKCYEAAWTFFSNLTAQQGLLIANFVLVIVTIIYVSITRNYANHTKRMADVMYKDYELRITPQYEIIPEIESHTKEHFHGYVKIKNKGLNTIYVRNVEIFLIAIEPDSLNSQYQNEYEGEEYKIKPDDSTFHYFRINKRDHANEPFADRNPFFGEICNVNFRAEIAGPDFNFKREGEIII